MATKSVKPEKFEVLSKILDISHKNTYNLQDRAEKRVAFFIAIASASAAIVIRQPDVGTVCFLFILLCYGLETLQFLNWTKIQERIDKDVCDILLSALAKMSPTYFNMQKKLEELQKSSSTKKWHHVRGGLAEFMYLSNSFLLAGIVLTLSLLCSIDRYTTVLCTSGTFLSFLWIQYKVSQYIRKIGLKRTP